jgi:hypothetical protein
VEFVAVFSATDIPRINSNSIFQGFWAIEGAAAAGKYLVLSEKVQTSGYRPERPESLALDV